MIIIDPNNPKGIVWIASYPKSGNTWIRIFIYHILRMMVGAEREENDLEVLSRATGYEARLFGLFDELLGKPVVEATKQEIAEVREHVHAAVFERAPRVAMVKTHNLLGMAYKHPTINLNVSAGTIYIVRDPRDVVVSLSDHLGCTLDQGIGVLNHSAYTSESDPEGAYEVWGSWSEHVKSWTMVPNQAVIVVRYEDLLEDPFKQFSAIVKHLRESPSEEQIREAIELSSFKSLYDQETAGGFRERSPHAERFFRVGKAGQWRGELSTQQVNTIVGAHGDMMRKFGYL